ncbi:hypothetical protein SLEP1_g13713 [Rubroshorea leprosula]|uniref:Uncharacterized protein n=1 Tax=Rubroshorea leprosula TaxID=152421 RepID=A0AAV5ISE0_9ROSI|nr:hypothetical protein SLEP1_g13713 [Rubroshorea leprosula]
MLAGWGWLTNLIVYLIEEFNVKSIDATQITNVVTGGVNLLLIISTILADSFLGSFSVVAISSCFSLLGVALLTLTASISSLRPPPCDTGSSLCQAPSRLLGTPTESDLGFVQNEDARRYIRQLPSHQRQPLASVFPNVHPLAIDLADGMLTFDPTRRITGKFISHYIASAYTSLFKIHLFSSSSSFVFLKFTLNESVFFHFFCAVEEALAHPYLERLHDIADEPVCPEPFSFDLSSNHWGKSR